MIMRKIYIAFVLGIVACNGSLVYSQNKVKDENRDVELSEKSDSKAWEFGLGGSLINWSRVSLSGFQNVQDNYLYNLKAKHLMGGANIYIARELNKWFYLDLQGTVGLAKNHHRLNNKDKKYHSMYMGGLGLQFRFTPLFKSQYVEPYLRAGINYLHKDFNSMYNGNFANDPTGEAHWGASDIWNPEGRSKDKNSFFPASFGAGVNAWLSNSLGLGLQGEYLMPLQKDLPHFVQISARVIWRIGGKSKHQEPIVQYVEIEKPIERIVEKIVEKRIEVPVNSDSQIYELLDNIHFDFDKDIVTAASEKTLDKLAIILKKNSDSHFLITGYTDSKGSDSYNLNLSMRRAKAVYEALLKRNVPANMLKYRGVGKRISAVSSLSENRVREGDRKVLLERVTNMEYWNALD